MNSDENAAVFIFYSTISSGLNSLAAVTLQDIVRSLCFKDLTDAKATLASKILGKTTTILIHVDITKF